MHLLDDQLPENRLLTPSPDFHLRDNNSGPSEPVSWAFKRQGLGNVFDSVEP
jgi:hypothetical protein